MSTRIRVLVIGSGKRVRETALPALLRAQEHFEIAGVCAKSAKDLRVDGNDFRVEAFADFDAARMAGVDMVYVAVGKAATPQVLQRLIALGAARCDLLIDTPVLVFKHFRHVPLLARFRNAWVAEDCAYLPWIPLVHGVLESGMIGKLRSARFEHSAYAYHAHATLKALKPGCTLLKARTLRLQAGISERRFLFSQQWSASVLDPRDYSRGRFLIQGEKGALADAGEGLRLELLDGGVLRAGDLEHRMDQNELSLLGAGCRGLTLTAAQESMKKVGFLRMLREIAAGRGAYPLADGLDDMVADYWLEKTRRYWATPLSSVRSPLARGLYRAVSTVAGR